MRSVFLCFWFASANAFLDKWGDQSGDSTAHQPLAFAFAPGGLLFPYYLGVAYQLRDLGLLRDSTPISGASAGSIVASAIAFGLEESEVRASLLRIVNDVRGGEQLRVALAKELETLIPENAPELAKRHGLTIGYYEVYPQQRAHIVSSWESKHDVIETILASCNFPFYFSKWPLVKCRGGWGIDGMFSTEGERFGCPVLPGTRTVAVVAATTANVHTSFDAKDTIQPGQHGMELPSHVEASEWLQWSLSPASDSAIDEIIEIGRAHARAWAIEQYVPQVFKALIPNRAALDTRSASAQAKQHHPELQMQFKLPWQRQPLERQPPQEPRSGWMMPRWPQHLVPGVALAAQTSPNSFSVLVMAASIVLVVTIGVNVISFRRGGLTTNTKPLIGQTGFV